MVDSCYTNFSSRVFKLGHRDPRSTKIHQSFGLDDDEFDFADHSVGGVGDEISVIVNGDRMDEANINGVVSIIVAMYGQHR